jgi:bis(5'-nucleosyl)-tetraphosphatase (symmetrical)
MCSDARVFVETHNWADDSEVRMATYAIGDVQGCFAALQQLLEAIAFDPGRDQVWFAGDLVNRGPQSLDTLRFVKDLGDRAVTVLGNHDVHLLAVASGQGRLKASDTFGDVLTAPDRDALLTWLRHRPLLHHDATLGLTLVHAGLPPQWTLEMAQAYAAQVEAVLRGPDCDALLAHLGTKTPGPWAALHGRWERLCYMTQCFTQLRYCDTDGRLALDAHGPPGSQPSPFLPWFALPQRAWAAHTILFGHWATLGPCQAAGVHALDTGCVWGGALTAFCLETKARVSIPCGADGSRKREE